VLLTAAGHVAPTAAWGQAVPDDIQGPFVGQAVAVGVSAEVHRLPVAAPAVVGPPVQINPRRGQPVPLPFPRPRVPDRLAEGATAPAAAERTPAVLQSFDGISAAGLVPPDPIGDVGPNHYVQMVNTRFAVYSKSGVLLSGPTSINQLFAGLPSSPCATTNDGDPVVVYDRLADRWLLSQFAVPGGAAGFHLCVAVSQTANPTGAYFLYDFAVPVFPDYFKIGVWPDGYYVSTNEEGTVPNTDVGVYALDRARMLQGLSASVIRFLAHKNFLLPSDSKGAAPPAGSPNYFYTFTDSAFWSTGGVDRLDLYAFHADFATPANSTFTALPSVPITPFNYTVCGHFITACLPQPPPGETIDAISEWPMWRFFYRNMGTHEAVVGNFTVDVGGGHAGIRWFELRKTGGGNWTLFQEGTHAPDAHHRFMGSIGMDASGNIALGYSVTSGTLNPSLRYATRLAGAAAGTLEAEATLVSGGGVQTNGFHRWGDYSAMTIDPADDCTFWYTGEYYATTSPASWNTRIGSFKIPTCTPPPAATLSATPGSVAAGGSVTATWSGIPSPTTTDWIGLYVPGTANTAYLAWIYVSCSQTPGSAMASGSCAFPIPGGLTPGTYELRLLSNNGFTLLATSNNFTVTGVGPTLSASPSSVVAGASVTATWSGIPSPTTTDWIGLYAPGAANTAYIAWVYVSCTQTPGSAMASGSCALAIPGGLTPGTYQLRLLSNNGYTLLATSNNFTVTGPTLGVAPTSVPAGGSVTATWSGIASPTTTDWIGLYMPGAANTAYLAWIYVSCSQMAGAAMAAGSCAFTIPSGMTPGTYELRLLANNGFTRLATSGALTVTTAGPGLSASPPTVVAGGSVTATWSAIPSPTTTDWIGLYMPGAANTAYIAWVYVSCSQTPGAAMAAGSCPFTIPGTLTPGTYELRLLSNNGYTGLATSNPMTVN